MNRQVVGFLSLFSLVVVLSTYYVFDTNKKKLEDTNVVNNELQGDMEELSSSNYYFKSLSLARDEKHQDVIKEQVEIISSNDTTSEEVISARGKIELEQQYIILEEEFEKLVLGEDFISTFCEITPDTLIIKAYNPSLKEEDEFIYVDSIFVKVDQYINSNNISFLKTYMPCIELIMK